MRQPVTQVCGRGGTGFLVELRLTEMWAVVVRAATPATSADVWFEYKPQQSQSLRLDLCTVSEDYAAALYVVTSTDADPEKHVLCVLTEDLADDECGGYALTVVYDVVISAESPIVRCPPGGHATVTRLAYAIYLLLRRRDKEGQIPATAAEGGRLPSCYHGSYSASTVVVCPRLSGAHAAGSFRVTIVCPARARQLMFLCTCCALAGDNGGQFCGSAREVAAVRRCTERVYGCGCASVRASPTLIIRPRWASAWVCPAQGPTLFTSTPQLPQSA
eukprot:scaffold1885_cov402-Prasinococcus_capsulatus_cf.AAC.5